jgi:signal transduction histidine kinase
MTRVFPTAILMMMFASSALAQNQVLIDSLRGELALADTRQRYEILSKLAWEYRFAHPDSTISLARQAYALGQELNVNSLAQLINYEGVALNYKGDRIAAYGAYQRALEMATTQRDTIQIGHSNNNLGRLFYDQGLLARSYDHLMKAEAAFTVARDSSGIAYALQSLANLFRLQRDYAKSEHYHNRALQIRQQRGNARDIMSAHVQLGRLYQEAGNYEKSTDQFRLAERYGNQIHDEINLADIKIYLAQNYLATGQLKLAEQLTKEGFEVIDELNSTLMLPRAHLMLGEILFQQQRWPEARHHFDTALLIARQRKDIVNQMEAHEGLWLVSKELKQSREELVHLNFYLMLKDSLLDLDLARQAERAEFQLEIEKKERENQQLKEREARNNELIASQKMERTILITIIASLAVITLIIWLNAKRRRETNEQLALQNKKLSDLNHEKDTLMSIVAHDLKSPLNRVHGLATILELEGGLTDSQRNYTSLMKASARGGLDMITDLLDVHALEDGEDQRQLTTFNPENWLNERLNTLGASAEAKSITLNRTMAFHGPITSDPVYLSRILDNLVSNAIKFSPKGSTVYVAARSTPTELQIKVRDEGPGFSEQDRQFLYQKFRKLTARPTGNESSNGLGLAIVKTLIDRLHGSIDLSTSSKGSEFMVRIPVK